MNNFRQRVMLSGPPSRKNLREIFAAQALTPDLDIKAGVVEKLGALNRLREECPETLKGRARPRALLSD